VHTGFVLVESEESRADLSSRLAARLSTATSGVFYLDGENSFRVYAAAEEAAAQGVPALEVLEKIRVARAFTCFQMVELLGNAARKASREDIAIVAGPCKTFADESVTDREVSFFHRKALDALTRINSRLTAVFQSREELGRRPWLLSQLRHATTSPVVLPEEADVDALLEGLRSRRALQWDAQRHLSVR